VKPEEEEEEEKRDTTLNQWKERTKMLVKIVTMDRPGQLSLTAKRQHQHQRQHRYQILSICSANQTPIQTKL
jgi:hypothetical protein